MNNIILLVHTYVRKYVHTYVSNQEKYDGYFYQTMSINNALLFFQNIICQCVSKHFKSSIKFHQHAKYIIETNKKGE